MPEINARLGAIAMSFVRWPWPLGLGISAPGGPSSHPGTAGCWEGEGHATSSICTDHGWTYDLQGKLVAVPGFKDYYHEELDREAWGLVNAAKVGSFKGFIFATLDAEAPELEDY